MATKEGMTGTDGDGHEDDRARATALLAALADPTKRAAVFAAMLGELIMGAQASVDDDERERYSAQALSVSVALELDALMRRLDGMSRTFGARVDRLTRTITQHDERAIAAIDALNIEGSLLRTISELSSALRRAHNQLDVGHDHTDETWADRERWTARTPEDQEDDDGDSN